MKRNLSICVLLVLLSASYALAQKPKQWFEGGNLHNATIAEWRKATPENRLATASDWLAATKWKGMLTSKAAFDALKIKSQILADGVTKVGQADKAGTMKAMEIAGILIQTSNNLGPDTK